MEKETKAPPKGTGKRPLKKEKRFRLHVGLTISETARAYGITQKKLASKMGYSQKHLSELVQGKTPVTPKTAIKLEEIFGASAEFWLNLQSLCSVREIREETQTNN